MAIKDSFVKLKAKIKKSTEIGEDSGFYKKRKLILVITAIILPLIAMLLAESFSRGGFAGVVDWVQTRPLVVVYNYLIYLALFLVLHCIFNRLTVSGTVFVAIVVIYTVVNINKFQASGLYFNPNDLKNQRNVGNFAELMVQYLPLSHLIFAIVAVLAAFIMLFLLQNKHRMKTFTRIVVSLCCVGMVLLGCNTFALAKQPINKTLKLSGFMAWEPNRNYINNGMLGSFLGYTTIDSAMQAKPDDYSEAEMQRITQQLEETDQAYATNPEQPDKVIVILAESFMDVTRYENVEYSIDPLADVREDMIGDAIAGVVAGTTANTEFEVLTGFSMYPLQTAAVPYTSIYKSIPSLPKYFKSMGYSATALHTYYADWYRRNEVYDSIGFDEFIAAPDFPQVKKGYYISDDTMANKIIEVTDNDEKQFIFAITMQNHSPYNEGKYEDDLNPELSLSSPLKQDDEIKLLNYVQGVNDSSLMYKKLKDYYEARDENVVILFFGDHTPLFPNGGKILADLDYYSKKDEYNSRVVPLALWSNYLPKAEKLDAPISFNYLGAVLTEYCGMEQSPFLRYTAALRDEFNVVTSDFVFDKDGKKYSRDDAIVDETFKDYFTLEYDSIYGERHADEKLFEKGSPQE